MAQDGIGFSQEEVERMVCKEAARLSGADPDDLRVHWVLNGKRNLVRPAVFHRDGRTPLRLPASAAAPG